MDLKPIPAFYCCYLLRSTVRHASVYVGSTPHPARRLAQHNGKVKGGAVRTSRLSLRPWEMTCIVAGFPSNIAALQFEWAWQNAHLTRQISATERISFPTTKKPKTNKNGRMVRRPGRPRTSLLDKLSNLHLLLRAPYFSRWPLEVRFFSQDTYETWQNWCTRVDTRLSSTLKVILDLSQATEASEDFSSAQRPTKRRKIDLIGKGGVEGVDPTYARMSEVLEKGQFILEEDDGLECTLCHKPLALKDDLVVVCPHGSCSSLSHLTCLFRKFLEEQDSQEPVPVGGCCPSCNEHIKWHDVMAELSLRLRGQKEIRKLLSKKRPSRAATAAELMDSESEEEQDLAGEQSPSADNVVDEEGDDGDDMASIASLEYDFPVRLDPLIPERPSKSAQRLEIVIEDSDDER